MNIFQDLSLVSVSLQMHSQMCLFVNAVGNQDGLSQMCSPLCIFCFTSISGSSKSSPPEESHDDERLADWIKLILHSCLGACLPVHRADMDDELPSISLASCFADIHI